MRKIKFLSLSITSLALMSCSTSADDQFKYVTPPPTQQNIDSNDSSVTPNKKESTNNGNETFNKQI
ncbi:hypothetical protein [Francisella sp. SYW-9]|uniref:hypothetical protein n=1 Tax=Francisella sp. SYW-9 TaxID=2610888 RepID=UPI00123C97DF|nr:hypothetical protein [Francisella sp. SYW-9]